MKSASPHTKVSNPFAMPLAAWVLAMGAIVSATTPAQSSPIIPGFERTLQHASTPGERSQNLKAGLLLMTELNCAACHEAPAAWASEIGTSPGPRLSDVGTRLSAPQLRAFVSNPHTIKPGTRMPALWTEDNSSANDRLDIEALTAFLGSLRAGGIPHDLPAGRPDEGSKLYHTIGCVACHAPGVGVLPGRLPEGQSAPPIGDASVPIALAGRYNEPALTAFLLDPLHTRPAGRMPAMLQTAQEAADIAAYLRQQSKVSRADNGISASQDWVAQGAKVFSAQRCSACHETSEAALASPAPFPRAKPMAALANPQGCLAPERVPGTPFFSLAEKQREALRVALETVRTSQPAPQSPAERANSMLAQFNCHACHVRDGIGGPDAGRAPYFTINDPGAESLGDMAHLPPNLDRAGRKLTPQWLAKLLWEGGGSVRPAMNTRMPRFARAQTEPLIPLLETADVRSTPITINTSGLLGHQRAETGRKLLGSGGLACISCHGLKERKSLGPPVVALHHTTERLRPEFFKELLLDPQATQPGTIMPPFFIGRKAAEKEIESIWTYLKEVESQPLPEGLFSNDDYELKPQTSDRTIVLRSFIEGAGTRGIGVGFPVGIHAAFDAKTCRWTLIWKGRFLDALSNYQDRAMKPIAPLGTDVKALGADASTPREFVGYRLGKDGTPTFLYREDDLEVSDSLTPNADGLSFTRTITKGGIARKETLSW